MEHAEDLVPVLYDHARKPAARKYRWREGKALPLGKTPEDIVGEVYVSFIKGEGSDGKHIKETRNFDPSKDLMLQLKGSHPKPLTDRSSAKNERATQTRDEEVEPIEFGVTPPFLKNCTLGGKVRKRLAPKWTQLAISESSVTSPMIVSS
jgi:hypothetical protein